MESGRSGSRERVHKDILEHAKVTLHKLEVVIWLKALTVKPPSARLTNLCARALEATRTDCEPPSKVKTERPLKGM